MLSSFLIFPSMHIKSIMSSKFFPLSSREGKDLVGRKKNRSLRVSRLSAALHAHDEYTLPIHPLSPNAALERSALKCRPWA